MVTTKSTVGPHNITIENETTQCPDFPFELTVDTTYLISKFEHVGSKVETTTSQKADANLGLKIISALVTENATVRALNLTALNDTYSSYVSRLNLLPKDFKFVPESFLSGSIEWMKNLFGSFWEYIETFGIILALIANGLLLILIDLQRRERVRCRA